MQKSQALIFRDTDNLQEEIVHYDVSAEKAFEEERVLRIVTGTTGSPQCC
jgi:hypothetical protein